MIKVYINYPNPIWPSIATMIVASFKARKKHPNDSSMSILYRCLQSCRNSRLMNINFETNRA
jgi:hypothetical protein